MRDAGETTIGGRYRLDEPLGIGGMATVFAGHDTALDRPVAIKLLRPHGTADERATQRLLREARAMARVVHPDCIQVFDGGTDPRHGAFLVMERLEGVDLARYLGAQGPLPVGVALGLIEQLCSTVQAVHDARLVHRDLKPSNVFVLRHAEGTIPRIKLLDFGVAKLDGDEATLTEPGDVLGTLVYMAPERWTASGEADVRADVYALGAILHELLAGAPPFRGETKAALRLAILNDPPEALAARRPDLPPWLLAAIEAALDKTPDARPDDVRTFARALGLSPTGAAQPGPGAQPFLGTRRFRVERCLFRGPDTEVYAASDLERGRSVAVKRMQLPRGEAAFRLKQEFRVAAGIRHPNLVRLDALWEERGELLLAMELVEGVSPVELAAGRPERARSCVRQLARGLAALHEHGLSHGDVKPQNMLVEASGRLVLLDGGLTSRRRERGAVHGTTAYLAPEALEGQLGPEADLYAAGVVLYELLTGTLPAPGVSIDDGAVALAGAPPDLATLCVRLLGAEASARPRAAELASLLQEDGAPRVEDAAPRAFRAGGQELVGREDALRALEDARARLGDGEPQVLLLEGESGMGKSALLERFRQRLATEPGVLVLSGRARRGDALPFPVLDEVIDALGSDLARLPDAVVEALLPRRMGPLAQLFPTLMRVPAIAREARHESAAREAVADRRLAFDGLRKLLTRLCDRRVVVMLVDDLQWIDADSRALLVHLLGAAAPPPMLFVGAMRTGAAEASELPKFEAALQTPPRRVALGPLNARESRALLRARWSDERGPDDAVATRLIEEGQGVPFFLELLALERPASGAVVGLAADQPLERRLDDLLLERARALPTPARHTLELICVAFRAVPAAVVLDAVGLAADDLDALLSSTLVRSVRAEPGWALEPFHDKVRDAVRRTLAPSVARAHHRRLAEVLKAQPGSDPEVLVAHLAGAGELEEAARLALQAARAANAQLAFGRAAALFGVALERGAFSDAARVSLLRERSVALRHAGRRQECGDVLLAAAAAEHDAAAAEALRREAGTHLLHSGDVQRSLEILGPFVARAGLSVPASLDETIAATGAALGELAQRGLAVSPPVVNADAAERIDLCLDLAQGLAHIDLRVLPFACRALLDALALGDPRRLQRACALFVINTVEYVPNPLVAPTLALCRALTAADPTPYARALLDAAVAENAHFEGDFLTAEAAFEHAERTLLESCPGATRELATVRDLAVFVQYAQKGDFKSQLGRTRRWLAEADAARDVYHASMLRVAHAIVWIAQDQPESARQELRRAQDEWLGEAGVIEVAAALYHDIIDRYEERDLVPTPPTEARASLLRSPAAQTPFLSGYLGLQSAWTHLRALARGRADADAAVAVAAIVERMRGLGLILWSAVADALEGNLDYLAGGRERAVRHLDEAEKKFRRASMSCLAACARKRRGQFIDGEVGARLLQEADVELRVLGVVDVERWTRAYWSMFDAGSAALRTQTGP